MRPIYKFLLVFFVISIQYNADAADVFQHSVKTNWKIIIPVLKAPPKWNLATPFSDACNESMIRQFEGTFYEVIMIRDANSFDSSTLKKRDLIVEFEKSGNTLKNKVNDTIVLWLKFKTGFTYSRISIPFRPNTYTTLPDSIAFSIYKTVQSDFLGELQLQGGPQGCTMSIADLFDVTPPCKLHVPANNYEITTRFPGFTTRRDSVSVNAGEIVHKRIFLLPIEQ
jgi:hypothetical protein